MIVLVTAVTLAPNKRRCSHAASTGPVTCSRPWRGSSNWVSHSRARWCARCARRLGRVGEITYRGSQPWPFPHSLMIGFRAGTSRYYRPDPAEIAEAQWLRRDDLPVRPPNFSISRTLITGWVWNSPTSVSDRWYRPASVG